MCSFVKMAASNYTLPPPPALEIHDSQAAEKWKKFKRAWTNYSLATELNKKSEAIQVATLLTVIGEDAREVYSTFTGWAAEDDKSKIEPVLAKFEAYCQPRKNIPFERYRFNHRVQEPGETYDQYRTALRQLAEGCDFATITPDEILRDRLVFGIQNAKARERLLRESKLTLEKADEICRAAESMLAQLKVVEDSSSATVSAIKSSSDQPQMSPGNVGTVGVGTSFTNVNSVQHMARHVTNAINQTILQPSVVASPLQSRSNWLMTMKSTKLTYLGPTQMTRSLLHSNWKWQLSAFPRRYWSTVQCYPSRSVQESYKGLSPR